MGRVRLLALVIALALLAGTAGPANAGAQRTAATKRAIVAACAAKKPHARVRCMRGRAAFEFVAGRGRVRPATLGSAAGGTDGTGTGNAADGGAPAGAIPSGGASAAPPGAPLASTVGADAYDFGTFVLRLTRTAVPAGDLTIYFRNHDSSEHNLWLDPPEDGAPSVKISGEVPQDGGATKTVAVTTGTWRLYCSLAGHGTMTRELAVS
jgi:plastocyanin